MNQLYRVTSVGTLLWYVREYSDMKTGALEYVSESDVAEFSGTVDDSMFEDAATLLQVEPQLITNSINRFVQ